MWARNRLSRQKGMMSLVAAGVILTALSGLDMVMELGDKMVLKQALNNHAQAIAPTLLRAELALTQKMVDTGQGVLPEQLAQQMLSGVDLKPGDYQLTLTYGRMVADERTWTDPKTGVTLKLHERFVPCNAYVKEGVDSRNCSDPAHPKAGLAQNETPVPFDAISVEIRDTTGILNFHPVGRAIFGLPASATNDGDLGTCFCNNRYEACLKVPLDTTLPLSLQQLMGQPDTSQRKNYCDFGLAPSVTDGNGVTWSKYPTVPISAQWLGKTEARDETGFIRKLMASADMATYQRAKDNLPIQVVQANPFPDYFYNLWTGQWNKLPWDKRFYALEHDGDVMRRRDVTRSLRGDYAYREGFISSPWDKVYANGWFYVGRKGTCIADTTAADVPKISATVDDPAQLPTFDNTQGLFFFFSSEMDYPYVGENVQNEIRRCLSYKGKVGNEWATLFGVMPIPFTHRNKYAYFQNSCVDYARQKATRVTFFQWMIMSWTWPFIDWTRQYQALDCTTRKMRWYGWFHWGYWRAQRS